MKYIQQQPLNGFDGLGRTWFGRAVGNVAKFVQQTDLVSHAAHELGVGKTTVGKILVPTASNNIDKYQTVVKSDMVKPQLTIVNATTCANPAFAKDQRCIEFNKAQAAAVTSQQVIAVKENLVSNKQKYIIAGSVVGTIFLIALANTGGGRTKSLSGVKKPKRVKSKK